MRSGVKGAPESDLTSEGSDRVREWTNGQHEEEAEEKESLCTRSHPKVNCKMHKRRRRRLLADSDVYRRRRSCCFR